MTEANMRRLPSWMLKVKTVENPSKSATEVETSTKPDNVTKTQAVKVKSKPLEKKKKNDKIQTHERKFKQKEDIIQVQKTKRRKTQTERNDEDAKKISKRTKFVDEVKTNESTSSKQQMKKQSKNCDAEVSSTGTSDDEEVSLTVDDLLSIAEEYVSADRKRRCKDQTVSDKSSKPLISSSAKCSKFGVKGAVAVLSKCTSNSLDSQPDRSKGNESSDDKIDNICSSAVSTGDAVQDMLNLYIGPYINKPAPPAEPSVKAVESENTSMVQEAERKRMPSVSEFNRQIGSFEIPKVEADVRLTKKKSSLRDMVSMFID